MSEGMDKTTLVEIHRITAETIQAGHHAVNLPYQDAKKPQTIRNPSFHTTLELIK